MYESSLSFLGLAFEPNNNYSGACHLWALASVYEPQPSVPICLHISWVNKEKVIYRNPIGKVHHLTGRELTNNECRETGGEVLLPGHQKALLALSYRKLARLDGFFDKFTFGQFNRGSGYTDVKDIYPHEFIQLVQFQLGKNKFPLIVDTDLGEAVWNYPLYRVQIKYTYVDATTLKAFIEADYVRPLQGSARKLRYDDMHGGLKTEDGHLRLTYQAKLFGHWNANGKFEVKNNGLRGERSEWLGSSIDNHPDAVVVPPKMNEQEMSQLQSTVSRALNEIFAKNLGLIKPEIDYQKLKSIISFEP